jgi:hypothetical protein
MKNIKHERVEKSEFLTKDTALAAFLKMRGFKLVDLRKEGHEFIFVFEYNDRVEDASLEFVNSEFALYEASLRGLRKLVKAFERGWVGKETIIRESG